MKMIITLSYVKSLPFVILLVKVFSNSTVKENNYQNQKLKHYINT